MKSIDSRKVNVPILCFAAEEDRWQLARTLYCGKNMDNLQSNSDINADGSYDQTGYNQMNQMAQNCTVMGVGHTALAVGFAALGAFVNPYFFILSGTNGLAAAAWYSNTSYINNSLDFNHAVYVGAFRYEDRTDCRQFLWWKTCTTKTYTIPESHDGIVSVKSQYLATTKGTNVIIPAATIKNVNHMEEFNHKNTKAEFSNAIEKGTYGPTFKKN